MTATPQIIPLTAQAAQSVKVQLSQQDVRLDIRQRGTGLYMDVWLNDTQILTGVICEDRNWIVRDAYFGMPGDLLFLDQEGTSDPTYDGLGDRYVLAYVEGANVG